MWTELVLCAEPTKTSCGEEGLVSRNISPHTVCGLDGHKCRVSVSSSKSRWIEHSTYPFQYRFGTSSTQGKHGGWVEKTNIS